MINFTEGIINIEAKHIAIAFDYKDINVLVEEGFIAKREDGSGTYYYAESAFNNMKFGIFIRLREGTVHWLVLHWLYGPCTSKGWDEISEKALKDEYRLLLNFVEENVGAPPESKRNRQRTWRFKWGQVDVSYEPRDFVTAIFMKPR